jgi:hypothetical protein
MEKQTLRFPSFTQLSSFVKQLNCGYLINTNALTITAKLRDSDVQLALLQFSAALVMTNEKVYSYDAF